MTRRWSTSADVREAVERRWRTGSLLTGYARGEPFGEISVPLRGPTPSEVAADLEEVRRWRDRLVRDASQHGRPVYDLVVRRIGGRAVGHNELPARALLTSYEQAWSILGVHDDVARFDRVREQSHGFEPAWLDWVVAHPFRALAGAEEWPQILAAASWLRTHAGQGKYLREISVPGVDTKFIERHRPVLADLLEQTLETSSVLTRWSRGQEFALRYGFCQPEPLVRLRAPAGVLPGGITELGARVEELAALRLSVRRVVVVENEVSYLALPLLEDTALVFGSGYTVARLGRLSWLADCAVDYWGDIDSHGFAILSRLRARLPHVRSVLMDRATLFAHRDRWVTEPSPTRARLESLTVAECDLYRDLVEDTFGAAVRLEQERIDWDHVMRAIAGGAAH